MSFASKFNKGQSFNIDTTGFTYVKLADLYKQGADVIHRVDGMYVFKGKIETQPVFIDAQHGKLVNAPAHLVDSVREILNDAEAVQDIKDGKVGYTIREYESHGKKCYTVNWVDVEPEPDFYR